MKKSTPAPLTHAYWLAGKLMVMVQSTADELDRVNCSWMDGSMYKMQRLPLNELLLVPSGLTDKQRAEYVLANLPKSAE